MGYAVVVLSCCLAGSIAGHFLMEYIAKDAEETMIKNLKEKGEHRVSRYVVIKGEIILREEEK